MQPELAKELKMLQNEMAPLNKRMDEQTRDMEILLEGSGEGKLVSPERRR